MFTQNLTRQLYVVKNVLSSALANPGDIIMKTTAENEIYFNFMDKLGKIQRTDLIPVNNIINMQLTAAKAQAYTTKANLITLNADYLTEDEDSNAIVINGQDYLTNIKISQYYNKSDYNWEWKHGAVHAAMNMTPAKFYAEMALSIFNNFVREPLPILKVYVTTAASASAVATNNCTEITSSTKLEDLTGAYKGVVLDEAEQYWRLGQYQQEHVDYTVATDEIIVSGSSVNWGIVTPIAGFTTIKNGKNIADMEWFYHGERGDIYREYSYPNNFDSASYLMVDPTKEYDTLDIHYYWSGANHAVQKSEKDITLVIEVSATSGSEHDAANALAGEFTGFEDIDDTDADTLHQHLNAPVALA